MARVSLVEFGHGGHQPRHLLNIIDGWPRYARAGWSLRAAVSSELFAAHPEVVLAFSKPASGDVELVRLAPSVEADLKNAAQPQTVPLSWIYPPGPPASSLARLRWNAALEVAGGFGASKLLLMNVDEILMPLAAQCGCDLDIYGILHAPPLARGDTEAERKLWSLHQRAILARALTHPRFRNVFTFDPSFKDSLSESSLGDKVVVIPDPVLPTSSLSAEKRQRLRRRLGIKDNQVCFFFFGELARRKGLIEFLSALSRLDPEDAGRVSLIVAGPISDIPPVDISVKFDSLLQLGIHVVRRLEFISENDATEYFEVCDIAAVPYLRYVGISGVLLRAASHRRPVLAQSYGLIGELVRRHSLGIALDPQSESEYHAALRAIIRQGPRTSFDADAASQLAGQNNVADYQRIIFGRMCA